MKNYEKSNCKKSTKLIAAGMTLLKLKVLFIICIILTLSELSFSQSLVEPLSDCIALWFPKHHECVIMDMKGNLIEGKLISGTGLGSSIKWIKVRDSTGKEVKLEAADIKTMKVKASNLIKFSAAMENTALLQISTADWEDIVNKEYLFYEQALAPKKKKDKFRLYLLLNPGFDSKIKVFDNPGAGTSTTTVVGIKVSGGKDKSYLFVKNNQKSFKVKKGDYKKQFAELYGDCKVMLETFGGKKNKFKDLPGHVFVYDQACKE